MYIIVYIYIHIPNYLLLYVRPSLSMQERSIIFDIFIINHTIPQPKKDRTVGNLRIMEETSLITSFKLCSGALLWTRPERLLVYAISLQGGALSGNS